MTIVVCVDCAAGGCGRNDGSPTTQKPETAHSPASIQFSRQEIPFRYFRGESGAAWPNEVTGGGVGLFDYDGDGDLDLFFAQGVSLAKNPATPPTTDVILRNDGHRGFKDVSSETGLTPTGYGQGVTIADYDGDGDPDVYVTRYKGNTLWRNEGGHFVDATTSAGVSCGLWSLGAAFLDYDRDGDLDLFVANYFTFDPAQAPFDRDPKSGAPDYGMPARFDGQPDVLYRNNGDGTFTDITEKAGVAGKGRGMGALACDLDLDGWMDILVANDVQPNAFWHNNGDGTFTDLAEPLGLAVNAQGQVEANMGIARGDTNGDGLPDVVISHFFNEHDTLWRAERSVDGRILFQDQTLDAGLGVDSRPLTGWGIALADFNLDGRPDLVVATGHIRREPGQRHLYENPPILWQNVGDGRFRNVTATAGPYFQGKHQGRGLAVGDLDGDGRLDVVIVHHHQPSVVLWNDTPRTGHWLGLRLKARGKTSTANGVRITATMAGQTLVDSIDGGGGYLSSNSPWIHLGLGNATVVDRIEVRWPSGNVETREKITADQILDWGEGDGHSTAPTAGQ